MRATKVPLVGVAFWVVKILTTGMGETTSDFLAHGMRPIVAVPLGAAALWWRRWPGSWGGQLPGPGLLDHGRAGRVFGTMVADAVHVGLGIPYHVSTVVFAIVLAAVFWAGTAARARSRVHSILTRRRESFYWATVLATFALGTAVGDLTATTFTWDSSRPGCCSPA